MTTLLPTGSNMSEFNVLKKVYRYVLQYHGVINKCMPLHPLQKLMPQNRSTHPACEYSIQ
jgi:hypothetical protein